VNAQEDSAETENEIQSSTWNRRVSASTSPSHGATPGTDQDDQEDGNGEGEDEDDQDDDGTSVIDDAEGGAGKHGSGAQEDDERIEDEIQVRVPSRQPRSQVCPLISEVQM